MRAVPRTALLVVALLIVAACGGEEAPEPSAPAQIPLPARTPGGRGGAPVHEVADAGPIRPGCGDYRLLVRLETDAQEVGVRVSGPANAVDVVWVLSGPGLGLRDPPSEPRVFTDDNRDLFGVETNFDHQLLEARFVLLISGVRPGQRLELEMGHGGPGESGTWLTISNARRRMEEPDDELASIRIASDYQRASIDLCASRPMPPVQPADGSLEPRLLAFYYPWWGTMAEPDPPYRCSGDSFGWIRDVEGLNTIVTAHLPIPQDGDQLIYRETACWMRVSDDHGRAGWIYDVHEVNFLAEQMQLAKAYGLDGFAASVHGDNPLEMAFLRAKLLPVAEKRVFSSHRSMRPLKPGGATMIRRTSRWWVAICAPW